MSNLPKQHSDEIELSVIMKSFSEGVKSFVRLMFGFLQFLRKHLLVISVLIIGGAVGGYMLDNNLEKNYRNELIVIPNFESVTYLYDAVDMLNAKLKTKDSAFFNHIGLRDFSSFREFTIEPVTDVYNLVKKDKTNLDVFKIFAERGDIEKVTSDMVTSKYYRFHKITAFAKGESARNQSLQIIMGFLNSNTYFDSYGKIIKQNFLQKIVRNKEMISQIDSLLQSVYKNGGMSVEKSINVSEKSQYAELFNVKAELIREIAQTEVELEDAQKTIREVSIIHDIPQQKIFSNKTISLPFLLLGVYCTIFFLLFLGRSMRKYAYN
jgi:hypothetical protein